MYRVKLVKGRSYTGAVKATRDNPLVDVADKKTADALIASGYFVLVSEETPAAKPKSKKAAKSEETSTADYGEDE